MHVAASKQLLPWALYLLTIWEEIGLSAGNFVAAVAHHCWGNAKVILQDETTTTQAVVAPWLTWRLTDWWAVLLIHVAESPPFSLPVVAYDGWKSEDYFKMLELYWDIWYEHKYDSKWRINKSHLDSVSWVISHILTMHPFTFLGGGVHVLFEKSWSTYFNFFFYQNHDLFSIPNWPNQTAAVSPVHHLFIIVTIIMKVTWLLLAWWQKPPNKGYPLGRPKLKLVKWNDV